MQPRTSNWQREIDRAARSGRLMAPRRFEAARIDTGTWHRDWSDVARGLGLRPRDLVRLGERPAVRDVRHLRLQRQMARAEAQLASAKDPDGTYVVVMSGPVSAFTRLRALDSVWRHGRKLKPHTPKETPCAPCS